MQNCSEIESQSKCNYHYLRIANFGIIASHIYSIVANHTLLIYPHALSQYTYYTQQNWPADEGSPTCPPEALSFLHDLKPTVTKKKHIPKISVQIPGASSPWQYPVVS